MREVLLMWRDKRMVLLTIGIAVVYTLVLVPFKQLGLLPGFSTIRPANVLPVVFGLMFGPAAAWGSLLGNLAGDILGGTWSAGSYFGAVGNFFTAFVVYRLWGNLGWLSTGKRPDLATSDQFPEYLVVSFTAGAITAAIIGWGHEIVALVPFPIIALTILFNNTLAELFLGPPLLYLLYPRVQARGLLYQQLLDDRSLPSTSAFQGLAALALVGLSTGWVVVGSAYGILVEGISVLDIISFQSIQAGGSMAQVVGGSLLFCLVFAASLLAGERLSRGPATHEDDVGQQPSTPQEFDWRPYRSTISGAALVGLGVTLAALYEIGLLVRFGTSSPSPFMGVLQVAAGLVLPTLLMGAGWWLYTADYTEENRWRITLWTYGGTGIVTVLSAWQFYQLFLGIPATDTVIEAFLLNVQAGAFGGLVVGLYDARASATSEALAEERETLRQQNETLERLVSVMSHDIRNPLNVINQRTQLAQEGEKVEVQLEAIRTNTDRIQGILEDTLTLTRQTSPESVQDIDVAAAAEHAWGFVDTGAATLETTDGIVIEADLRLLEQLFENAFRNALEHGCDVTTVRVGAIKGEVEPKGFFVEDDGIGIPESDRDRVLEDGYTTSEAGTGLGLSIISEIVAAHGWRLAVCEADTGGARFEVVDVAPVM
ncbi:MAG: ATP-binding protein [Natrinema limicola]